MIWQFVVILNVVKLEQHIPLLSTILFPVRFSFALVRILSYHFAIMMSATRNCFAFLSLAKTVSCYGNS